MKKITILLFFTLFVFADEEIQKIKDMTAFLSQSKQSFDKELIKSIKNPFVSNFANEVNQDNNSTSFVFIPKKELELLAIFQNRVKINEKWYKLGDFIESKKLIKINKKSVVLKGDKELEIFLKGTNGVVIKVD